MSTRGRDEGQKEAWPLQVDTMLGVVGVANIAAVAVECDQTEVLH